MMRLAVLLFLIAGIGMDPAFANPSVRWTGRFTQGALLLGETEPGAKVWLDGKPVRVHSDGRFVIGFGYDAPPTARLEIENNQGRRAAETLTIEKRQYDIQRIDGLPPAQVTPPPQILDRIKRENERIADVRRIDTADPLIFGGWVWPADGRVTGIYGSQRILNGEARQPHFGIDIAAPEGSPVRATTDGIVTLADADLYFTGGTIIIDHGFGVSATYSHLKTLNVKEGDRVRQGQVIATVGSTGRSTGPHLDWRVNWFNVRIDPQLVLPPR